jgi:hypothetical protein
VLVEDKGEATAIPATTLMEVPHTMSMYKSSPRIALVASLVAAICVALAPAALAAKGGGHSGEGGTTSGASSISLVVVNSSDGLAHWDGEVTFDVSTSATSEPWVELTCSQNGVVVYIGRRGFFERSLSTQVFTLASNGWTGGAADCTAWLDTPKVGKKAGAKLASTSFHVYE